MTPEFDFLCQSIKLTLENLIQDLDSVADKQQSMTTRLKYLSQIASRLDLVSSQSMTETLLASFMREICKETQKENM